MSSKDAARSELQEQFIAVLGHELRTPLTALHGYVQLLHRQLAASPDEMVYGLATRALQQSRRLVGLVEDLLDTARLENRALTLELERIDLRSVVDGAVETVRSVAAKPPIEVEVDGAILVDGDSRRLEQVLLNLLKNGVEHASESKHIDVRLTKRNGMAEIAVEDQGPGIPEEELPKVFSPFYQARPRARAGALGLGLFIAREIVAAHQGSLELRSEEGKGTRALIVLPLADPPASGGPSTGDIGPRS